MFGFIHRAVFVLALVSVALATICTEAMFGTHGNFEIPFDTISTDYEDFNVTFPLVPCNEVGVVLSVCAGHDRGPPNVTLVSLTSGVIARDGAQGYVTLTAFAYCNQSVGKSVYTPQVTSLN